jgi:hypothetical protein
MAEGKRIYAKWHKEMMVSMPKGYREDPMDIVLREAPGAIPLKNIIPASKLESPLYPEKQEFAFWTNLPIDLPYLHI